MSLKVGSTVQLKSGGPRMTVVKIGTMGDLPAIECSWFDGATKQQGSFPADALIESPEPKPVKVR